jgi:hypothetical protein
MIISHKYKYIFFKTSKTAGTSVEIALSKYCGPEDVIAPIARKDERTRRRLGYPGRQNYLKPWAEHGPLELIDSVLRLGRRRRYYNHIPARMVREFLPDEIWESFFKFSVVRNPFDYVVSRYFWSNRDAPDRCSVDGFRQYVLGRAEKFRARNNSNVTHIDGRNVMDFMIRFEHFEEDLGVVSDRTGLPVCLYEEFKALSAKKGVRPKAATTSEMFSGFEEGVELITEIFKEDIETYGYKLP